MTQRVGEVVHARAGDEVFERLVEPLLGGINVGNVDYLSIASGARVLADAARRGGPFIEALREQRASVAPGPVFHGVKGGTQRVIDALHDELSNHIYMQMPAVSAPGIGADHWFARRKCRASHAMVPKPPSVSPRPSPTLRTNRHVPTT